MPDSNNVTRAGKSRWKRRLALALAVLVVLVIASYFLLTSSSVLKAIVLPRLSEMLGAEVTAARIDLRPRSQLRVQDLQVRTTGATPLFQVKEALVRYQLRHLLSGRIQLDEVKFTGPSVDLVLNADGTSNLDPIRRSLVSAEPTPPSAVQGEPLQLSLNQVQVSQATIRWTQHGPDNRRLTVVVDNASLGLDQLANGQSGRLTLQASVRAEDAPVTPGAHPDTRTLVAALTGNLAVALDSALMPQSVQGRLGVSASQATGAWRDYEGLSVNLECEVTPKEIRRAAIACQRGNESLGRLTVSGPFVLDPSEADLAVTLGGIDARILNLVGAARGWDFGRATLSSTNRLKISPGGGTMVAQGALEGHEFSIRQTNLVTPILEIKGAYEAVLSLDEQKVVVNGLELQVRQDRDPLVQASLSRPMTLSWAAQSTSIPDSSFQLMVTNLNLAQWRALSGDRIKNGQAGLQLVVQARNGGRKVDFNFSGQASNVAANWENQRLDETSIGWESTGAMEDFRRFEVTAFKFNLGRSSQRVVDCQGAASGDIASGQWQAQLDTAVVLRELTRFYPIPALTVAGGTLRFSGKVSQQDRRQQAVGKLRLSDFTGTCAAYQVQGLNGVLDADLELDRNQVRIQHSVLTLARSGAPAGQVQVAGKYDLSQGTGQLTFRLTDLNQRLWESWGDSPAVLQNLSSALVSAEGSVDLGVSARLKTDLTLANLVLRDSVPAPAGPGLGCELELDGSWQAHALNLAKLVVRYKSNTRAQNQLEMNGRLDLSPSNAAPSLVSVRADSLDLTPWFDLWYNRTPTSPSSTPTQSRAAAPNLDSGLVSLPIQQATLNLNIGRLYLREIAVSNWVSSIQLDRNKISWLPSQWSLNGAPVSTSAGLNLSLPGFLSDLSLDARQVPVRPILRSFAAGAAFDYQGDLTLNAHLKNTGGAASPGASAPWTGQIDASLTNGNLRLPPRYELVVAAIGTFLQRPELANANIHGFQARARIDSRQLHLDSLDLQTEPFQARLQGVIPMADDWGRSPLNLPLTLALATNLTKNLQYLADTAATPTNAPYVVLLPFAKLGGTLGVPAAKIDRNQAINSTARQLVPRLENLLNRKRDQDKENDKTNADADDSVSTKKPETAVDEAETTIPADRVPATAPRRSTLNQPGTAVPSGNRVFPAPRQSNVNRATTNAPPASPSGSSLSKPATNTQPAPSRTQPSNPNRPFRKPSTERNPPAKNNP